MYVTKGCYILLLINSISALEKIIGGVPCKEGAAPFTICVKKRLDPGCICGGVLLSEIHSLTACHCLYLPRKKDVMYWKHSLKVYAGTVKPDDDAPKRTSEDLIPHPNCKATENSPVLMHYDYGIIKHAAFTLGHVHGYYLHTVTWDFDILTMKIEDMVKNKGICSAYGWGAQKVQREPRKYLNYSKILRKVNLHLIDWNLCEIEYIGPVNFQQFGSPKFYENGKLCTLDKKEWKATCLADSGGPLVCNGTVVAIVSEGIACGAFQDPILFSRIDYATSFLAPYILHANYDHSLSSLHSNSKIIIIFLISINIL